MRRKVIQDFANVFCQRFIDLPSGYDLALLVHLGSGVAALDILTGECTFNNVPIRQFAACVENRDWLEKQCHKHNITVAEINKATMTMVAEITNVVVQTSFGYTRRSACFNLNCHSEITTNEKVYEGRCSGEKIWGFGSYWEMLFGAEHQT